MKPRLLSFVCVALILSMSTIAWGDSFDHLIPKVPPSANTLVLIDVERTLASPLAQAEGWGKKLELAYVSRPVFLPPEATKLVMASALEAENNFAREWELGVMELSEPMSMRSIARSEGGYVDTVQDTPVAWTPSDAYFVSLSDRVLGVMFPADRQFVSRWIGYAMKNDRVMVSDYLRKATRLANEKIQVLMAIDLTDISQPHELAENAEDSPILQKTKLPLDQLVTMLGSLRGATLRIAIGKEAQGQLRIDFDEDVTPLKSVAKEFIVKVLGEMGAVTEDLESWKLEIKGKTIVMRGKISQDGLRRVFSIVELPSAKFSLLKEEAENSEEKNESLIRESSLTYFHSTGVLLKDLKRELRGNKASAAIMERYASRIDRMAILHVDDDLLDYGSKVAETLRVVALSKRQGGVRSGVGTAGMGGGGYANYSSGYGYSGNRGDRYAGARASAADRSAIKSQAMAESKNMRVEGSKLIADATAQIRRQMTQKYQVEF
ncbi:MAG: hypothetical protein GXP28_05110 [Planctomycetes bacterium]|nr:hypothetical protein [Planctomycetota bacterium]